MAMTHKLALSFSDGNTVFVEARPGELLLDAAMRHGVALPVDCREGVCGTCRGRCESGLYELDYADEETLSPADLKARAILACQTRVKSEGAFSFDFSSDLCRIKKPNRRKATVTSLDRISDEIVILRVSVDGEMINFLPGQYAKIRASDWDAWRAYSFANCPNRQNGHQFLIRVLPGGLMGRFLAESCQIGTQFELEGPFGSFYLREVERTLVLAAGGTGLAAFIGMLEEMSARPAPPRKIRLYYGVNRPEDLCALAQLEEWRNNLPDFDFVTVIAQPPQGYEGRSGYVTDHFDRPLLEQNPADVYVCGPPPMVDAVKNWLGAHGHADNRLFFEKFVASQAA